MKEELFIFDPNEWLEGLGELDKENGGVFFVRNTEEIPISVEDLASIRVSVIVTADGSFNLRIWQHIRMCKLLKIPVIFFSGEGLKESNQRRVEKTLDNFSILDDAPIPKVLEYINSWKRKED